MSRPSPLFIAMQACAIATLLCGCSTDPRELSNPPMATSSSPAALSSPDLVVYGCAPGAVGTVGATFKGIPAYCQPSGGGYYQCDELGNRFMRDAYQHPNLDNVVTELADAMCPHAATMPQYSVWGPGYRDTTGKAPLPGDLVVFSGELNGLAIAHVAVVTGMDADNVHYMQQNMNEPTGSTGWDAKKSWFSKSKVLCWIHPEPVASPPPPSDQPDCGCFDGEGDYCGLAIVDHQAWFGCGAQVTSPLSYDNVYSCSNGVFSLKSTCSNCVSQRYTSALGYCADNNPCGHVFRYTNGTYCGSSTDNGFSGGAADSLYTCTDGIVTATAACSRGCTPQKGGSDKCD